MRVRFAQEFGASFFEIKTANELKDALKQASQRMGFDHFALSLEARASDDADTQMLLHDYPDEWAKVYTSFDLVPRAPAPASTSIRCASRSASAPASPRSTSRR